jgi:ribosomal protein S12 methylthiotransferase
MKRVHIVTLGCSKNTVDSETLAGHLHANAFTLAPTIDEADTVIINTCGFIDAAKEESVNTILAAGQLKKTGKIETLVVAGCLSERYGDELRAEIPEVDHFFGTEAYEPILRALSADLKYSLLGERVVSTPKHYAYLKISEGCDNPCSFCAIPIMRGGHRSLPADELVRSAQSLVAQGAKELVLVAQDLTYYGLDVSGKRGIADLLRRLADESGADWIRCMYAYPSKFPFDMLEVIRERSNICTYLDMPLQHASTEVLKSMRRGITRRTTEDVLRRIRDDVPDITLRTTFIVGYPNETQEYFDELLRFVEDQRFDRLGVFTYSQEDDTYADILGDPIPADVKESRKIQLMDIQRAISAQKNAALIGSRIRVLVEEEINGEYRCRSEADAPEVDNEVYVRSDSPLVPGTFVEVTIDDAAEYDLFASVD